ncbi:hypothetical protein [Pigmentibacter ruber]|uniref:hypothetical protein n=1 Tax=Pigmentibacter ruber TaxID=2683196 RepID=UPI00131AE51D|nr:hypothetical protein [Pigmentibacter ruber]
MLSILELAQLALDVYCDPKENDIRKKYFNDNWEAGPSNDHRGKPEFDIATKPYNTYPTESCPKTGLYARVYIHKRLNYGVLAIRGTEKETNDFAADSDWLLNNESQQLNDLIEFHAKAKKHFFEIKKPLKYVCGHSLGGILGKSLAPISKLPTCAFNSPGVLDFVLANARRKGNKNITMEEFEAGMKSNQVIVTFVANRDMVGERKNDADLGTRIYLATRPFNPLTMHDYNNSKELQKIVETRKLGDKEYPTTFEVDRVHSMVDLFKYFYVNDYENVYLEKYKNFDKFKERYFCHVAIRSSRTMNPRNINMYQKQIKDREEQIKKYCTIYDQHKENFKHYLAVPLTDELLNNPVKQKR